MMASNILPYDGQAILADSYADAQRDDFLAYRNGAAFFMSRPHSLSSLNGCVSCGSPVRYLIQCRSG